MTFYDPFVSNYYDSRHKFYQTNRYIQRVDCSRVPTSTLVTLPPIFQLYSEHVAPTWISLEDSIRRICLRFSDDVGKAKCWHSVSNRLAIVAGRDHVADCSFNFEAYRSLGTYRSYSLLWWCWQDWQKITRLANLLWVALSAIKIRWDRPRWIKTSSPFSQASTRLLVGSVFQRGLCLSRYR
jgi:hypothetical protein